jgi:hypothetical protein
MFLRNDERNKNIHRIGIHPNKIIEQKKIFLWLKILN